MQRLKFAPRLPIYALSSWRPRAAAGNSGADWCPAPERNSGVTAMSLVLNTNVDALVSQNSLTTSGGLLSNALQQLSSGLRINTAADDAAGYAISNRIRAQSNGINQAARNANDRVSLAQTGSGAITQIVNDLQTMRNLAVQSLNATNTASARARPH